MRTMPAAVQNVVSFAESKPLPGAKTNDEILIELDRRHAKLMRQGDAIAASVGTESNRSDRCYFAAEAIFNTLTAFPAQSLAGLKAKVAIMRREWRGADAEEILGSTHNGPGTSRGKNDVIASILDDMRRLL